LKQQRPWTNDEILRDYKFTNVYRELDRSSQFIINNILIEHNQSVESVVFRTLLYRFFNLPDSFEKGEISLQSYENFDSESLWEEVKQYRRKFGNPWHTAYMANVVGISKTPDNWDDKVDGKFKDFAYAVLVGESLHSLIKVILNSKSIKELIKNTEKIKGVSSFMSHEFYLDLIMIGKYWKQKIFEYNENDYTNVGPGASLGIRLIFPSLQPKEQIQAITWLRDLSEEYLSKYGDFKYIDWKDYKKGYSIGKNNISLHQIEFFACEFSKYFKMKVKAGKQRSKFIPKQ
jgi:hypothetical protein